MIRYWCFDVDSNVVRELILEFLVSEEARAHKLLIEHRSGVDNG